ncbi:MAG: WG repeat-containing protein [Clostridia bacterium]|nr:WG repeat-containing protein [Clostridia bacterium]
MSKGKRYNDEQKLNPKKVLAVLVVIALIVLFIFGIKNLLKKEPAQSNNFSEISYFPAYQNDKWGVINSKGDVVINPEYSEMIMIPDSKKDVFICYEVNYADGTYKTKAINSNSAELYNTYASVDLLSNNDENGNVWNEDNVLKVSKDGKYGLINLDGTELLSCSYEKIEPIKGVKNSILVYKDGKCGLVNNRGEKLIENEYQEITALTTEYTDGYIVKNQDSKFGIISTNKEVVLECKYEDIMHICGNDLYAVKADGKWFVTNKAGDKNVEVAYNEITYIGNETLIAKSGDGYGIYGLDKSEKVKPEYQSIQYAFADNYIAKKDNKCGVINSKGETLVQFEYDTMNYNKNADCIFAKKAGDENTYLLDRNSEVKVTSKDITVYNGYIRAKIDDEYKFYNLKFEEKTNRDVFDNHTLYVAKNDGKFGLVNKDGTLVVQYQYEDVTEQNEYGYVTVKKDGKWGVIDQYGNVVVEPKYDYSDISKITFVGKWHSIEDVNPVYFICE